MKIYIRTRGFYADYRYLPQRPSRESELAQYQDKSDLQYPSCILERTKDKGGLLFLSGIISERKNNRGAPIRYDLFLELDCNDFGQINYLITIIKDWLEEIKLLQKSETKETVYAVILPKESKLGKLLDETVSETEWEELLNSDQAQTKWDEDQIEEKIKQKFRELSLEEVPESVEREEKVWCGGINDEQSCKRWKALVQKLLKGEIDGKALLLNIAKPESLTNLVAQNQEEIGVLLAEEASEYEPRPVNKSKVPSERKPENSAYSRLIIPLALIGGFCLGIGFDKILPPYENYDRLTVEPSSSGEPTLESTPHENYDRLTVKASGERTLELTLEISKKKEQPDKICVFSVTGQEFNLDSTPKLNGILEEKDTCNPSSLMSKRKNNEWTMKHTFGYSENRTIRIKKIYESSTDHENLLVWNITDINVDLSKEADSPMEKVYDIK
jgi:hypothetical protein